MFEKFKFWLIIVIALILAVYMIPTRNITDYFAYAFSTKNNLSLNLSLVNPSVKSLASEPSNQLVLRVEVKDLSGSPVPKAHVNFSVSSNIGQVYPGAVRTDKNGEYLVSYIPPPLTADQLKSESINITISAGIYGTKISSSINVNLIRTPVIFVHGYLAGGYVFDNMREYLSQKGYEGNAITYKSQSGIVASAEELNNFIQQQKMKYLSRGVQVKKFDVVSHSMGGLITRYYTCGEEYIKNNDIRKIIFISVPHRGSLWASIGVGYYNDQGIKDLIPDSPLLSKIFPSLLNRGLNSMIQVGSIIGQYDEVVSPESASLEEWGIKTEVFNVGENNFNMNNILSGNIVETANHAIILNNKKVFEKIAAMLGSKLSYPSIKK